ncbi:MAG TPA: lysylphosphatidylglycerol synthase transmembrane domain-containing protein [Kofleriaceae bacterium]|nr:lysylphosphatidylglycerol synthase transmembrane domain-containing protein [Kofleriaceae bacterium]
MRALRWQTLLRVAVIGLVVAGVWWMLRGLHLSETGSALADAIWWPIIVAAVINFGLLACKAVAWHVMLGPEHVVPIRRLFRYTITAFAASVIVPARGGEVLRIVLLKRNDGVPATRSTAVALAEKLLDGLSMLIIMAPLPWLLPDLPPSVSWWIGGLSAIALAILIGLRIAVGRVTSQGWLGRLISGMAVLKRPRRFVGTLAMLTTLWLLDVVMVKLVAYSVDIPLGWPGALLVLFTLNLAIALPSTPGQVGALELGAVAGLKILGVSKESAIAFGLLYHALQVVPLLAVGLILDGKMLFGGWRDEAKHEASRSPTADP